VSPKRTLKLFGSRHDTLTFLMYEYVLNIK